MGQKTRDQQGQQKDSVLQDKQQFGDERAEDKLAHMGSKPGAQQGSSQATQKQQK